MQNPTRLPERSEQASFLSPSSRKFLEAHQPEALAAELERRQELARQVEELEADLATLPPLEPVQRRVVRQRPRARKPAPTFFKLGSWTPAFAARELRRMPNRRFVAAIRVAAFSGGRTWNSRVAMGVIRQALAYALLADQRGVVRDVPQTLLVKAHHDRRTDWEPTTETIGGGLHHPDGDLDNGQAGYTRLLELAGALSSKQYRRFNPSTPSIRPSCNFVALCEPEVPITECETEEQCNATLEVLELARIPHPSSRRRPRPRPPP